MAKTPTVVKTASVLAFERKLATSDAVMYSGSWQGSDWQPIRIQEKAVRGTISNRLKNTITSDQAKLNTEIQKANLQLVDVAALPTDADTLQVRFTLRVLGNLSMPSVCNDRTYQDALQKVIDGYISEHGLRNWPGGMRLIWQMGVFCGVTALARKKSLLRSRAASLGSLMHTATHCVTLPPGIRIQNCVRWHRRLKKGYGAIVLSCWRSRHRCC